MKTENYLHKRFVHHIKVLNVFIHNNPQMKRSKVQLHIYELAEQATNLCWQKYSWFYEDEG
jgi:hypothetical protein